MTKTLARHDDIDGSLQKGSELHVRSQPLDVALCEILQQTEVVYAVERSFQAAVVYDAARLIEVDVRMVFQLHKDSSGSS